jgi:hypothetical protein
LFDVAAMVALVGVTAQCRCSAFCDGIECFVLIGTKVVGSQKISATCPENVGQFYRLFVIFHGRYFKCSWNPMVTERRKPGGWPDGYTPKSF